VRGFVRSLIHQPFALSAPDSLFCAFCIFNTEPRTVVVAEIELGKIAVQVLFADMVKRTDHAAFENGKIIFSAIDVDEAA
jgi:hypothetical protein